MTLRSAIVALVVAEVLAGVGSASARQLATAPRLRAGASAPLAPQQAIGGGEVVLDVTVGRGGTVSKVTPVRATPPYTDLLAAAVKGWSFDGAKVPEKGELQPGEAHVLVVAVYRPPQVYAAPAAGVETQKAAELSAELPVPSALSMPPAYPAQAARDGAVLIELELSMAGVVQATKVMSRPSPFDNAAVDTVKGWRFGIPRQPLGADPIYVYAVVGFREPITQ